MLHYALGASSYINMDVSVQGYSTGDSNEITTVHFQEAQKAGYQFKKSIISIHELYDLHLTIHVAADRAVLEELVKQLPIADLSLGKREYMVRIDSLSFVTLREEEDEWDGFTLKQDAYIPFIDLEELDYKPGYLFLLDKNYTLVNNKRIFHRVKTLYIPKQTKLMMDSIMIDNEDDYVFLDKGV
jgi:CRISPR-associated protein Cas5t